MASPCKPSGSKPATRQSSGSKLAAFVGGGREFAESEVPTYRGVMKRGILLQELSGIREGVDKRGYPVRDIAKDLTPMVLAQWKKSNAQFAPPVVVIDRSVTRRIDNFWKKVSEVVRDRATKAVKEFVEKNMDRLFDITACPHTIFLCKDQESHCSNPQLCHARAHVQCDCPLASKVPTLDLEWLYYQRIKVGEESAMMMTGVDKNETHRQVKVAKRKQLEEEAKLKKQKQKDEKVRRLELQEQMFLGQAEDHQDSEDGTEESFTLPLRGKRQEQQEAAILVDRLLRERLGSLAPLVMQYLDRPAARRNTMPVRNLALASIRFDVPPTAAAALASGFLQDLIADGHLSPDMSYLVCDPNKLRRARQDAMASARDLDQGKHQGTKIVGLGYDGRKDKTRAMVPDSYGKLHPRLIREEHVSVTEEPSGRYLWHFVPEDPVPPEKPAFKVAQALYDLLVTYDSTDSLIVLQGDSTRANTGWKGGTHAHLEKMLGRKLFWSICVLHTNELPLRHLITSIDGPTSSDTGFTGPVCSLLSSVNEMQYNAEFRGVPGGEDLTEIPEYILVNMSTDQQVSYQLVQAVKRGVLPSELQEIKCGKVSHSRWLTTAQSLVYMWTRKHGLTGKELNTLEILVKYCLQVYFKLYYDIKVHHRLEDGPKHILTQLRVMRSQPKKVQTAVTFYVRTGAWFAHSECVLLSLMASQSEDDRRFAVTQILKLRAGEEYGDTSVRPRITPKLNLSATSLQTLISWQPGQVHEPAFTCSLSGDQIQEILVKPYEVPEFSIHTQSTERVVKQVTEAAAAVVGQQARDGFIRARAHHRETMPCFRSKKDMMDTF